MEDTFKHELNERSSELSGMGQLRWAEILDTEAFRDICYRAKEIH